MVEVVLHIQLGAKCSLKMKLCDSMYRGKARISSRGCVTH